ncbi:MAG: hypothetical protein KKH66_11600, partial [Proteobacteria bacterium]|nr:hypothetical protein [Pseudomonadota bacterium]
MLGQLITSGIAIGATYALMALAMVIIYKTSEVLNFAQGDMAMLSAFVAYMCLSTYGLGFAMSFTLALAGIVAWRSPGTGMLLSRVSWQ